jgi:hypothetical protein
MPTVYKAYYIVWFMHMEGEKLFKNAVVYPDFSDFIFAFIL